MKINIFKLKISVEVTYDKTPIILNRKLRKIIKNIEKGYKLRAVKEYKDWKQCGLRKAKDMVDYYQLKYNLYDNYDHIKDIDKYQQMIIDSLKRSSEFTLSLPKGIGKGKQ